MAARKENPPSGDEGDIDCITGDWPDVFERQVTKAVAAWAQPGAWEGVTGLAGGQLPAALIGSMMIGELVVHG